MRIVVASPPKAGNHWIKCLLAHVYGLSVIEGEAKGRITAESLPGWIASGGFPDGSILHIHNRCTPRLCDAIDAAPAHIVTIIRDPYDAFLSMYHWQQQRSERELDNRPGRPRQAMAGKPLDSPEVLDFLRNGYGSTLAQGEGWISGGRAHIVRYEALHDDPVAVLDDLTRAIQPASRLAIEAAIDECRADVMRQRDQKMQWHIRSGRVGESREQLGPVHLEIFRQYHADAVKALGYQVR